MGESSWLNSTRPSTGLTQTLVREFIESYPVTRAIIGTAHEKSAAAVEGGLRDRTVLAFEKPRGGGRSDQVASAGALRSIASPAC